MRLSVVIPCFNELKSLPALIERCATVVKSDPDIDFVLVDNGSTDGSSEILQKAAQSPGFSLVRVDRNLGYGHGVLAGLATAAGDIIGWTHADLQTDPADVLAGLEHFRSAPKPDRLYVKGRRHSRPPADVAFTFGMSVFESALLLKPLIDINAQPNLFSRSLVDHWPDPPWDFSLDLFAYFSAKVVGFQVIRFPVRFDPRQHGKSHWNVDWRSKIKFIDRTIKYSFKLRNKLSDRQV